MNGKNAEAKYNAKDGVKAGKKSSGKPAQKIRHMKFGECVILERKGHYLILQPGNKATEDGMLHPRAIERGKHEQYRSFVCTTIIKRQNSKL